MSIQLHFNIEYFTRLGENIFVTGSIGELGAGDISRAVRMTYVPDGQWKLTLNLARTPSGPIQYKYLLKNDRNQSITEWGDFRSIDPGDIHNPDIYLHDSWRPGRNYENVFFSSAFVNNLMQRKSKRMRGIRKEYINHRFRLYAPRISSDLYFCISGNDKALGEWDPEKALILDDSEYPVWNLDVLLQKNIKPLEYKYGIYDRREKKLVTWEAGENRIYHDD